MTETSIQGNISDTACWVAAFRALESDRPDALFHDPLAHTLAGKRGKEMIHYMPGRYSTSWVIVVRTQVIDEMILKTIQDHKIDTVLNLAAGLDTRPYRLPLSSSLRWIEVDLPEIFSYKEKHLHDQKPNCQVQRVRLDLSNLEERREFFTKINQESKQILVITEGLLIYLEPSMVEALAKDLHNQPHFTAWIQDFTSEKILKILQKRWSKQLNKLNAPMKFAPRGGIQYFEQFGWNIKEVRSALDEGLRLKRGMALLRLYQATSWLYPQIIKNYFRKMNGYLLLER